MVTREARLSLALKAIRSFRNQEWEKKSLLLVEDEAGDHEWLRQIVTACEPYPIRLLHVPSQLKLKLGQLRNAALDSVAGDGSYVVQWDDDDQYHPDRIAVQMERFKAPVRQACFLTSQLVWFATTREMTVVDWTMQGRLRGTKRLIPGTILHAPLQPGDKRSYPPVSIKEDARFRDSFAAGTLHGIGDRPWLYLRTFHGTNTWDETRFRRNAETKSPTIGSVRAMASRIKAACRHFDLGPGPVRLVCSGRSVLEWHAE